MNRLGCWSLFVIAMLAPVGIALTRIDHYRDLAAHKAIGTRIYKTRMQESRERPKTYCGSDVALLPPAGLGLPNRTDTNIRSDSALLNQELTKIASLAALDAKEKMAHWRYRCVFAIVAAGIAGVGTLFMATVLAAHKRRTGVYFGNTV